MRRHLELRVLAVRRLRYRRRPVHRWLVLLPIVASGACNLPALDLTAGAPPPSIVGILRRGRSIQVGHPTLEGDSVLVGETWPDERLGWRIGDPFRTPLTEITRAVSLEDVGVVPPAGEKVIWAILSTARADRPIRWDGVYIYPPQDLPPGSCERIAILGRGTWLIGGAHRWSLEQLRATAGSLGANALHLSTWTDPETNETVHSPLFGPDWDYSVALALWCPALPPAPDRRPEDAGAA